jgi:hypothetical protein
MARYERDPKLRARYRLLLSGAEIVALTVNFYFIFSAYVNRVNVLIAISRWILLAVVGVATLLVVGAAVYQVRQYAKGQSWARMALVIENASLVFLGMLWFVHNRLSPEPERLVVLAGLVLPLATLFPLIWPLLVFKPAPPPPARR